MFVNQKSMWYGVIGISRPPSIYSTGWSVQAEKKKTLYLDTNKCNAKYRVWNDL